MKTAKTHKGEIFGGVLLLMLVLSFVLWVFGESQLHTNRVKKEAANLGYHKAACEFDNSLSAALGKVTNFNKRRDCSPYEKKREWVSDE